MEVLISLLFLILLLALGLGIGKFNERRHFASIARREAAMRDIVVSDLKTAPGMESAQSSQLVTGAVVVRADYFKAFAMAFRNLIGGEAKGLERMQQRGRREAVLRMLEEARAIGADTVCNVRIETSTISGKNAQNIAGVEVLAFGTALVKSGAAPQA